MNTLSPNLHKKSTQKEIQDNPILIKKFDRILGNDKARLKKEVYIDYKLNDKILFFKNYLKSEFSVYEKLVDRNDNSKFKYRKFPGAKKGNEVYSTWTKRRFKQIEDFLRRNYQFERISDEEIFTNILFITLTTQTLTYNQIKNSWQLLNKSVPELIRKLRRKFGNISYFYVFESHYRGGCHCHLCLILPQSIHCRKYIDKNNEEKYITDNNINSDIRKMWTCGLADVQGCYAVEGLEKYLSKEMSKQGKSIESILKHYDKVFKDSTPTEEELLQELSEKEVKQLLTFYYSIKNKMRLLKTSKSIKAEKDIKEETISEEIISDISEESPCYIINRSYKVVDRFVLHSKRSYSIYTGDVEENTQEYQDIEKIFKQREEMTDRTMDIREQLRIIYKEKKEYLK